MRGWKDAWNRLSPEWAKSILVFGLWSLVFGYWLLVFGFWFLVFGF
jgi:hypothetical protein